MHPSPVSFSAPEIAGLVAPTAGVIGARSWLNWAADDCARRGKPLSARALLVLLVLRDFQSRDGKSWPTLKTIAELAQSTPQGVRRAIRELEDAGMLLREEGRRESDRSQTANRYRITGGPPPITRVTPPLSPATGLEADQKKQSEKQQQQQQGESVRAAPAAAASRSVPESEERAARESESNEGEASLADAAELAERAREVRERFGEALLSSALSFAKRDGVTTRQALLALTALLGMRAPSKPLGAVRGLYRQAKGGGLDDVAGRIDAARAKRAREAAQQAAEAAKRAESERAARQAEQERLAGLTPPPCVEELLARLNREIAERDAAKREAEAKRWADIDQSLLTDGAFSRARKARGE